MSAKQPTKTKAKDKGKGKGKTDPAEQKEKVVAPKKQSKKPAQENIHLPVVLEFLYSFSGIFLIMITLTVILVGFVSGVALLQIFLRALITLLVVGFLLLLINSKVTEGVLAAAAQQIIETEQQAQNSLSNHQTSREVEA